MRAFQPGLIMISSEVSGYIADVCNVTLGQKRILKCIGFIRQWTIISARSNFLNIWQAIYWQAGCKCNSVYVKNCVLGAKYWVTYWTVTPKAWYLEEHFDEWVVMQMLAVQASLLHEVFLQNLYSKGSWPYFEFNKSFVPVCRWCINTFSSAYLSTKECWVVLAHPNVTNTDLLEVLLYMCILSLWNCIRWKCLLSWLKRLLWVPYHWTHPKYVCSYYLGNDTLCGKVSAEVQLGWGSPECWLTKEMNVVHVRIFLITSLSIRNITWDIGQMVVTVCSHLILVKPNGHAVRKEILHIEKSLLCWRKDWVNYFFLLLKNLILSEACSVQANVFWGNGRVNKVNWLYLSKSASASTKPKANLRNRVCLKCTVAPNAAWRSTKVKLHFL